MEALADIRCWRVQGGVASRKGQSTGDRITSQRIRGCDERRWSRNITANRSRSRRKMGGNATASQGRQEQEAAAQQEANAEAEVEAEAEVRITMMTTRLLVATMMFATQRVHK